VRPPCAAGKCALAGHIPADGAELAAGAWHAHGGDSCRRCV